MKFSKNIIIVAVVVTALVFATGCEKLSDKNEVVTDNIVLKEASGTNGRIVTIRRGNKQGEWPNQTCVGWKTSCWLWFQKADDQNLKVPSIKSTNNDFATYKVLEDANSFVISVDLSKIINNEELIAWKEDLANKFTELSCDVDISDMELLNELNIENKIVFKKGKYTMSNITETSFDIILPYESL